MKEEEVCGLGKICGLKKTGRGFVVRPELGKASFKVPAMIHRVVTG